MMQSQTYAHIQGAILSYMPIYFFESTLPTDIRRLTTFFFYSIVTAAFLYLLTCTVGAAEALFLYQLRQGVRKCCLLFSPHGHRQKYIKCSKLV